MSRVPGKSSPQPQPTNIVIIVNQACGTKIVMSTGGRYRHRCAEWLLQARDPPGSLCPVAVVNQVVSQDLELERRPGKQAGYDSEERMQEGKGD